MWERIVTGRMAPREQAETLRALLGLDFSEPDAQRAKLYDERRDVNRDANQAKTRLDDMPRHPKAPEAEVSIEALAAELEAADDENRRREGVERAIAKAGAEAESERRVMADVEAQIAEYERKIESAREALIARGEAIQESESAAAKMAEELEATPAPDAGAIRERVVQANAANAQVRENAARATQAADARKLNEKSATLSRRIEALDDSKAARIAAAEFPVDGLGFDEEGVTLGGVPFEQASSAEQLGVSVGMGLAMNPKLKLLLIRDGSLLDAEHRALIAEMAEKADAQVWMECVETNESTSVVIVDGAVQGAEAGDAD